MIKKWLNFNFQVNLEKIVFLKMIVKAVTYDERPKIKRDARLKPVFSPRKRLLSVRHLSSFLGVRRALGIIHK